MRHLSPLVPFIDVFILVLYTVANTKYYKVENENIFSGFQFDYQNVYTISIIPILFRVQEFVLTIFRSEGIVSKMEQTKGV